MPNHGSMHMSVKQNSNRLYGSFETSQIKQKLFEDIIKANNCLFLQHYWSNGNSDITTMQDGQFWMVHNHLFARSHRRNLKKAKKDANHSSSWCQSKFLHIISNKGIRYLPKHHINESSAVQLWLLKKKISFNSNFM